MRLTFLTVAIFMASCQQGWALFDVIIDDSQAEFSLWNAGLEEGIGNDSYENNYHFVQGWGLLDGTEQAESATVTYRLPPGVSFPSGERYYNIYAWMPEVSWEWHTFDIAADGTNNFQQDIDWAGQFGTNRQWIAADEHQAFDSELGGRWLKLGPGPQTDSSLGGQIVYMDPDVPLTPDPYIYVKYQVFYNGLIAFDAIRIVEVPILGDYNDDGLVDIADYTVWRDTLGQTGSDLPADGTGDGVVDDADYTFWKDHFGQKIIAQAGAVQLYGSSAVPEPASIVVLGGALLLLFPLGWRSTGLGAPSR